MRNIIFIIAFVWNVYKSIFTNHIATKITAIAFAGTLFLVLHFAHYQHETNYRGFFIAYNAISCVMILTAALRSNHTSPEGFWLMLIGCTLFFFSDVCYHEMAQEDGWWLLALRTGFLMVGSILVLSAGVHHVLYFKLKVQQMVYMTGLSATELMPKRSKKMRPSQSFEKTIEDPLI